MVTEIENILESVLMDESFEEALRENSFEVKIIDEQEDSDCHSSSLYWSTSFEVRKNNKVFSCYVSGTAKKEISYDRWVDTYCKVIDDYKVESKN